MSDQRYSVDLFVRAHAFTEGGWNSALADEEGEGYFSIWRAESDKGVEENNDN
ncbi:hypothetical protein [Massilia sp. YIM B04103]|uniref:hypothetical protein n=1 Tax=Massilia sp. YIM B04103 TaxID=2963106 RepID=UPI00210AB827|nr:hypothetical protein [Massilia sp. YIM B04103]